MLWIGCARSVWDHVSEWTLQTHESPQALEEHRGLQVTQIRRLDYQDTSRFQHVSTFAQHVELAAGIQAFMEI